MWLYDVETQVEQQLTFSGDDRWPIWSLDGSQVVFSSTRDGPVPNLYRVAVDGSGDVVRLTDSPLLQTAYDWYSDGETLILAEVDPDTFIDTAILRLGESTTTEKLLQTEDAEFRQAVSPDGRWMVYSSMTDVYVRPFPNVMSGRAQLVSADGGQDPHWGPDRQEIFYRGLDGITVVPVTTGETFTVRGAPTVLFPDVYIDDAGTDWDISADGQQFLMIRELTEITAPQDAVVVLNWAEELRNLFTED